MKTRALTSAAVLSLALPVSAAIRINEVHLNPPGTVSVADGDGDYEFIELISVDASGNPLPNQSLNGYTLLIVDTAGGTAGEVKEAWNLQGLSTGSNGLILLGNGYDGSPPGGPWANFIAAGTAVGDPPGMGGDNLKDNDAFTLMLVQNFVGRAEDDTLLLDGTDVDTNDDRLLGPYNYTPPAGAVTSTPPYTLIDSVGIPERRASPSNDRNSYAQANLTAGASIPELSQYDPDSFARRRNANGTSDITTTAAAWYGGTISGSSLLSVSYDSVKHFGLTGGPGEVTPGQPNLNAPAVQPIVRINEVSVNPVEGDDKNYEFIELISTNRNNASLAGLTLVVIDSSPTGGGSALTSPVVADSAVGEILEAWTLDGLGTGTNGLCLIGNNYAAGRTPWGNYVDSGTLIGSPSGMGDDDIGDKDGLTILLVTGYSGTARTGSTPGQDLDSNDDGVIDTPRWTSIVDSIGYDHLTPVGSAGVSYAPVKVAAVATALGLRVPDHLGRIAGDISNSSPAAWYGGRMGARHPLSIDYRTAPTFGSFRGQSTPGQPNLSAAPTAPSNIRLNEVHFGAEGSGAVGYVEVASTTQGVAPMNDLWLLIVDNAGVERGQIETILDLRGQSTGSSGLAVYGDGAEEGAPDDPTGWTWRSAVPKITVREDPQSYNADSSENTAFNLGATDLEPTSGRTILLVSNFSGIPDQDLDADNDGTYDSTPWTTILDSISFGPTTSAGIAHIGDPGFAPQNLSRYPRQWNANNAADWYYGGMTGGATSPNSVLYTTEYVGTFKGAASPGRNNHCATPATGGIVINELQINPPGGDNAKEFVELLSTAGISESLNGLTLLLVDSSTGGSNTGNVGNILEAWSLDGYCTGSNGLALMGDNYPTSIPYTGTNAPNPLTELGDPVDLDPDDIGREGDNGALSLLLVRDFSGDVGDDIDSVGSYVVPVPATPPGDGVIDNADWAAMVDSVGFRFWNAAPAGGGAARLEGIVYGFADLSQTGYTPDTLARKRGFLTANSTSGWYGGDLAADEIAYDAVQKFPAAFSGKVTPGQNNVADASWYDADTDLDGAKNLIEDALAMNSVLPDVSLLPMLGTVLVGSDSYPTLSYRRIKTNPGFTYVIQTSTDLQTWTEGNTVEISITDNGDGYTETVLIRPSEAYFNSLPAATRRIFLRLKATRIP